MSFLRDPRLVTVLRVALGAVFVMAAIPKLADPSGFAKTISNYHLLPVPAERLLALALPPLELLVGVGLIAGVFHAGASLLAFGLMLVFTIAIGTALGRGLDISCGCFDTEGGPKVGITKLLENAALIGVAFLVWRGDRTWLSLDSLAGRVSDIE